MIVLLCVSRPERQSLASPCPSRRRHLHRKHSTCNEWPQNLGHAHCGTSPTILPRFHPFHPSVQELRRLPGLRASPVEPQSPPHPSLEPAHRTSSDGPLVLPSSARDAPAAAFGTDVAALEDGSRGSERRGSKAGVRRRASEIEIRPYSLPLRIANPTSRSTRPPPVVPQRRPSTCPPRPRSYRRSSLRCPLPSARAAARCLLRAGPSLLSCTSPFALPLRNSTFIAPHPAARPIRVPEHRLALSPFARGPPTESPRFEGKSCCRGGVADARDPALGVWDLMRRHHHRRRHHHYQHH